MATIYIPTPLRPYTNGLTETTIMGRTASEALEDLIKQHPNLRTHLLDGNGKLRPYVNLFLNQDNIRDLQGLQTPIHENDRLLLIPSIAGGWNYPGTK